MLSGGAVVLVKGEGQAWTLMVEMPTKAVASKPDTRLFDNQPRDQFEIIRRCRLPVFGDEQRLSAGLQSAGAAVAENTRDFLHRALQQLIVNLHVAAVIGFGHYIR